MNTLLTKLNSYPFERLRILLANVKMNPELIEINLTIGEPMHEIPTFVPKILQNSYLKLSKYSSTAGIAEFRSACSNWLQNRYGLMVDGEQQILSINGSREGLFSFVQSVLTPNQEAYVVIPNPFYQIYEGAAILAGGHVAYANTYAPRYIPQWNEIPSDVWEKTQLVFVCTPGNPTGAVMTLSDWEQLFQLQQQYGFIIASDECYSEIYYTKKPLGILQAAQTLQLGFSNKIMFTSLSKRSNLPGLRSGFVAGDRELVKNFLKYRVYHGSAMSELVQDISIAAWQDESHVESNRKLYQEKFKQVIAILNQKYKVAMPDASFYLWLEVNDDIEFTKKLYQEQAVKVLPGSYLARKTRFGNPGKNMIRIALVAPMNECVEAAHRIIQL